MGNISHHLLQLDYNYDIKYLFLHSLLNHYIHLQFYQISIYFYHVYFLEIHVLLNHHMFFMAITCFHITTYFKTKTLFLCHFVFNFITIYSYKNNSIYLESLNKCVYKLYI